MFRISRPVAHNRAVRLVRVIRARPDAASVLALIVLPFLVFGRALIPGRVLSSADVLFTSYPWRGLAPGLRPGNDLLTDPAHLFQPWLIYAVSEVWQGRIPLWNPHVFAGSPFFANPQSALLFPLNWVALIVPVAWAFALIAILKVAAIGLATYWFLRVRALHPLAALMGAISFMWSGLVIVWLQWSYATTLIFFPMLFASAECLRIRPGSSCDRPRRADRGPGRVGRLSPRSGAGTQRRPAPGRCGARMERPSRSCCGMRPAWLLDSYSPRSNSCRSSSTRD
jgi:hypothetical protein